MSGLNPKFSICAGCGEEKTMALYQKERGGTDYARSHCVPCWTVERNSYQKAYRAKHAERLKSADKEKYRKNIVSIKANAKRFYDKRRKTVYDHYGNMCACCGETNQLFLTIDHIENDGAQHRKEVAPGPTFYKWLVDNNFPKSFRLLCFNCNTGRYRNGGDCPHLASRAFQPSNWLMGMGG